MELFNAQFRIQREASEAAGRHIPMVVENVKGAQKYVGIARWHFGSFYLWGDVPALMPMPTRAAKVPVLNWSGYGQPGYKAQGFNTTADQIVHGRKNSGGSWFAIGSPGQTETGKNPIRQISKAWRDKHYDQTAKAALHEGIKQPGISGPRDNGKGDRWFQDGAAKSGSKSKARKAASAAIAKIPLVLAQHIAQVYKPKLDRAA